MKSQRLEALIKNRSLAVSKQEFKLASGGRSNFFFDIKNLSFDPEGANLIADAIMELLKDDEVDFIGGLESGAIPIIAAVSVKSWLAGRPIPGFFVRKTTKERGTDKLVEGPLKGGSKVIIIDDVTTRGESVLRAVREVRRLGCKVDKVVTVVDRLEGARENLKGEGITLIPLYTRDDFSGQIPERPPAAMERDDFGEFG